VTTAALHEPLTKTYPAELKHLLERANAGDETALPELKQAFDRHPELAAWLGDLVRLAHDSILNWAAGSCLGAREAIARQASELRNRLMAEARSELERLLIDRLVICWMEVYAAEVHLAERLAQGAAPSVVTQAVQKVLDRAHQRFLGSVRCLATVQKLARPSVSPVEIATRLQSQTKRPAGMRQNSRLQPVTADN
jgi:hypothetical protein